MNKAMTDEDDEKLLEEYKYAIMGIREPMSRMVYLKYTFLAYVGLWILLIVIMRFITIEDIVPFAIAIHAIAFGLLSENRAIDIGHYPKDDFSMFSIFSVLYLHALAYFITDPPGFIVALGVTEWEGWIGAVLVVIIPVVILPFYLVFSRGDKHRERIALLKEKKKLLKIREKQTLQELRSEVEKLKKEH